MNAHENEMDVNHEFFHVAVQQCQWNRICWEIRELDKEIFIVFDESQMRILQ
jgi:hypothetical protein